MSIRVDNVGVGTDVNGKHGQTKEETRDARGDPVDPFVSSGKGKDEEGDGHEDGTKHHGEETGFSARTVSGSLGIEDFLVLETSEGKKDSDLREQKSQMGGCK